MATLMDTIANYPDSYMRLHCRGVGVQESLPYVVEGFRALRFGFSGCWGFEPVAWAPAEFNKPRLIES